MRPLLLSLLLCFVGFQMSAQTLEVKGNVVDSSGSPLPGVSVVVENSTIGASTDFDGNFTITGVEQGQTLVFSYLGFVTQRVVVSNADFLNVSLVEDTQSLDEVVVIGYGTQKVSNISGAVSTVKSESIEKLSTTRAEDALQGQAAGVNVIASGSPGAKPTVLIRGIPSYTGTDPLVVIDGVTLTLDDLNALNPSDIESMNVLKDAALTAIYGVSGGNGVIVVKTKGGRKNMKTRFSFDSSYGTQQVIRTIPVLNATEYAAILNEASSNAGEGLIFPDISGFGYGTDWQDQVIEDAPIITNTFTASGGSENTSYYFSAGYLAQDGIVGGGDKSYFDRTNVTANYDTDFSDSFKFIMNTQYANIKSRGLSENNIGSVLSNALNFDPTVSPYDENGNFGISETITQEIINPLAQIADTWNYTNTNKINGKMELQWSIIDGLKVSSRLGYAYTDVYNKSFTPLKFYGIGHNGTTANPDLSPIVTEDDEGNITSTHNRVSESMTNYFTYTYELFANYDFIIDEDHTFETVLGMSINKNSGENVTANAEDIPFNSWKYADVSSATGDPESQTSGSWQYESRNLSYFFRVNYDFADRYLVSFTGRRDGSTSFGKNNKFAFFPSASVGWVASNEEFWKSNVIDFFKVRVSYGSVGNDNIPPQFSTISTFPKYVWGGNIAPGSTLGSIPNDDISWENQIQINAGVDFRFFENKLNLTADYFNKTVDDLIFRPDLANYLGTVEPPAANIGSTSSQGLDLSIGYNDTWGESFNFNTSVNFTTSENKVESIDNGAKFIWGTGYGIPYTNITRFEEGFSPFYFYGYKMDGLFQNQAEIDAHATQNGAQPGDIRYVDVNEDGVIDGNDRTEIGDPFPDFTLGWNIGFDHKGFDFSMFTYASVGQDIYRAYERNLNYTNRFASTLDRWTGPGTSNTEPRVTFVDTNNNRRASSRYVEDGSFVKIKNIQLGYTLPESVNESIGFSQIRFFGQVKNAFVFTDYSGYDPEISTGIGDTGVDRGSYPQPRIWTLGLNLKF